MKIIAFSNQDTLQCLEHCSFHFRWKWFISFRTWLLSIIHDKKIKHEQWSLDNSKCETSCSFDRKLCSSEICLENMHCHSLRPQVISLTLVQANDISRLCLGWGNYWVIDKAFTATVNYRSAKLPWYQKTRSIKKCVQNYFLSWKVPAIPDSCLLFIFSRFLLFAGCWYARCTTPTCPISCTGFPG